jgi:formiminoglutamase
MKSKLQNFQFFSWEELGYQQFLSKREGELRLGERLVEVEQAKFVVLGIEESVGPKANLGNAGAENAFSAFCSKFLNMQSTDSLDGNTIAFLGSVKTIQPTITNLKSAVDELDDFVVHVLNDRIKPNQVLIAIGGGHNNAFPIIKSRYMCLNSRINCVNLDAHADYRKLEGRHSGNPFSYAFDQGFLEKYYVLGLHQRYNNTATIEGLRRDKHHFTFFEHYIDSNDAFREDIELVIEELNARDLPFGVELDMDAIAYMPSSAISPSGFSLNEVRYFVRKLAGSEKCVYFHLPEAAPQNEQESAMVGKALSYLVTDFITCHRFSIGKRLTS